MNNPKCIFEEYGDYTEPEEYQYLKNHPNLTIVAVKDSEVARVAKKMKITCKEVELPEKVTVTKKLTSGKTTTIQWNPVEDATKYQVFYSSTKNGKYTLVSQTTKKYYKTKKPGYFKIRAYKVYETVKWYGSFTCVTIAK